MATQDSTNQPTNDNSYNGNNARNENQSVNGSSPVNRRDFVKTAGLATAAAASVLSGPAVRKAKAQRKPIQYGFIGPGSRGYRLLERHLQHIDVGQCVALCDIYEPNLSNAMKLFGGKPTAYTDYRKLLENKDVEAVFITTPLYMHYPIMKDALEAGKHVFCEKSLVFKPEEVHGLRALHEANPNLTIQVGLQRRYSSFYQTAKQMVDKGVIGKVTHIFAQWHRNSNWRRKVQDPSMEEQINWRLYRKYSAGLAAELMSHQVDVADWMFGSKPQSVMGVGGTDYWKDGRDIYDNIQLVFEYPTGQKLLYSAISTNRHIMGRRIPGDGCREVIMGTDGAIEITLIPYGEGMWFLDPMPVKMGEEEKTAKKDEQWVAGATVADTLAQGEGLPIVPGIKDLNAPDVGFIEKEVEMAKRWLYQKGIMSPAEDKDPEYKELESFLIDVRDGGMPRSNIEVGLQDSIAVMLANLCMDEQRKIQFSEIETMGKDGVQMTDAGKKAKASGD
jgi:predicted dehydrogenase